MTTNSNDSPSSNEAPKNTMEEDIELATKHKTSLAAMYEIIEKERQALKEIYDSRNGSKEWHEEWNKKFGEKETIGTVSTRLVKAYHKLIPMEEEALARLKAAREANTPIFTAYEIYGSESEKARREKLRLQWKEEMIRAGYRLVAPPEEDEIPEGYEAIYCPGYTKNEW